MNGVVRIGRGMKFGVIPLVFIVVWEVAIRIREESLKAAAGAPAPAEA